jgi:hypothetical protein
MSKVVALMGILFVPVKIVRLHWEWKYLALIVGVVVQWVAFRVTELIAFLKAFSMFDGRAYIIKWYHIRDRSVEERDKILSRFPFLTKLLFLYGQRNVGTGFCCQWRVTGNTKDATILFFKRKDERSASLQPLLKFWQISHTIKHYPFCSYGFFDCRAQAKDSL